MRKGMFDLDDLSEQPAQIEKIGGMGGIMGMLPGMAKIKDQMAAAHLDDRVIKRQLAIISSMTPQERRNPDLLKASRKKRIAAGSGVKVEDVNRLLKQHRQMADMMKKMGGAGAARHDGAGSGSDGPGGGMPQPTPDRSPRCGNSSGRRQLPGLPARPAGHSRRSAARRVNLPPQFPGLGGGAKLPASAAVSIGSGGRRSEAPRLPGQEAAEGSKREKSDVWPQTVRFLEWKL